VKAEALTPDGWFLLTREAQDCLTAWWERVGNVPLRQVKTWTLLDDGRLEVERVVLDADGRRQVDETRSEFITEIETLELIEEVPDCWPTEEQVSLPSEVAE